MNTPLDDLETIEARRAKPRWQFSLRTMLLATAILSAMLAVAVNVPILFYVALSAALTAAGLQAAAWSMTRLTSQNRPLVAMVAWLIFGLFFLAMAAAFWAPVAGDAASPGLLVLLGLVPLACALHCFVAAWRMLILVIYGDS
jgi:hypothetical protein